MKIGFSNAEDMGNRITAAELNLPKLELNQNTKANVLPLANA